MRPRRPMANKLNAQRIQLLTTSTYTASVADVVCVIALPVNASASRPSLVKVAAARLVPTTAVDMDSAVPRLTLSTTWVKLLQYHSEIKFPNTPRLSESPRGVFTGHGSNTSNAIATPVTKVMTARFASVPEATTPKPTVILIVAMITSRFLALSTLLPIKVSSNSALPINSVASTIPAQSSSIPAQSLMVV